MTIFYNGKKGIPQPYKHTAAMLKKAGRFNILDKKAEKDKK